MLKGNQKLIGTYALLKLGSSLHTTEVQYLTYRGTSTAMFIYEDKIRYSNANGSAFFAALWEVEKERFAELATPQTLFELTAFDLLQAIQEGDSTKEREARFNVSFLKRRFGFKQVSVLSKYISPAEYNLLEKAIETRLGAAFMK